MSDNNFKLDYTLKTPQERIDFVNNILRNCGRKPTKRYLEILSDYIEGTMSTKESKEKGILTENRLVTINKRETSYEGLVEKFENGEDGVYSLIISDKNVILSPKVTITEKDIAEVPGLADLRKGIEHMEGVYERATGRNKFLAKKQIIEMRKEQYILKENYYQPIHKTVTSSYGSFISSIYLDDTITFDEKGDPQSNSLVSLFNKKHISAILCNYSNIKAETESKPWSDFYYLMIDFDRLAASALKDYPLYEAIVTYKIDGLKNAEIQAKLEQELGTTHTTEYLSSLWRNKIPKLIAEKAKEDYLIWHYTFEERGNWKKCSKCGEIKLAHNRFFSRNSTSKDGYYSICKCCRNKKIDDDKIAKDW